MLLDNRTWRFRAKLSTVYESVSVGNVWNRVAFAAEVRRVYSAVESRGLFHQSGAGTGSWNFWPRSRLVESGGCIIYDITSAWCECRTLARADVCYVSLRYIGSVEDGCFLFDCFRFLVEMLLL